MLRAGGSRAMAVLHHRLFERRAVSLGAVLALSLQMLGCGNSGSTAAAPATTPAAVPVSPAEAARLKLIERGRSLELRTAYEPPSGDALSHHTSGYVKTVCSAVFMTGYDAEFAAEHVGYFTGPYDQRDKVGRSV